MRLTPLRLALLFGAALVLLGPTTALTQGKQRGGKGGGFQPGGDNTGGKGGFQPGSAAPDGGGRGGFQPGGGGASGGGFDASAITKMIADRVMNGKDSISLTEVPADPRDPTSADKLKAWAQTQGITNGQLTREQFSQYMQEKMAERMAGRANGGGGPQGVGNANQPRDYDKEAEDSFRRRDKNNDGVLTVEEMGSSLSEEWQKYDANKDGVIDLAEYKEYYKARMQFLRGDDVKTTEKDPKNRDNQNDQQPEQSPLDEKKPTVYRVGNLPKELPAWFAQLDTDRDGQIGLYEWKRSTRDIREFMEIDKNGDGFITVEEVLRYQRQLALHKADTTVALAYDEDNPDGTQQPAATAPMSGSFGGQRSFGGGGQGTSRFGGGGQASGGFGGQGSGGRSARDGSDASGAQGSGGSRKGGDPTGGNGGNSTKGNRGQRGGQ